MGYKKILQKRLSESDNTKEVKDVIEDKIDGAGDFYFDEKKSTVWIPKMRENKLLIKKIKLN